MDIAERRIVAAVKDGRLDIDPSNKAMLRRFLTSFEGQEVDVVIRKHQRQRTLQQNAAVWSYIYPAIAEALGYESYELEELHYGLVAKCFGEHFEKRMGQMVPNKRSSKLSTAEFSQYMEFLVRFAAKECGGLVIELPDERAS